MHTSAYNNCEKFFRDYIKDFDKQSIVVDFGSFDVNGTVKPIFKDFDYKGIDISEGPNVDIVVAPGDETPFKDGEVSVVVSSSNFEHDECFWITFLEMCRITRKGGYIYINAPSAGYYHGYPIDCWRFFADSWKSLEKWAKRNKYDIKLVETYIDQSDEWKNSVGIFQIL